MISFKTTKSEGDTIFKIAARASAYARSVGVEYPQHEAAMDITATHANGCPLRLDELLAAPDFDFSHDVFGIRRHLDRTDGKLKDCFVPRFYQH